MALCNIATSINCITIGLTCSYAWGRYRKHLRLSSVYVDVGAISILRVDGMYTPLITRAVLSMIRRMYPVVMYKNTQHEPRYQFYELLANNHNAIWLTKPAQNPHRCTIDMYIDREWLGGNSSARWLGVLAAVCWWTIAGVPRSQ